jgi:prepilin-type N-terminal cleavage/methylation domain-containing protein
LEHKLTKVNDSNGFSLIELIVVIIIISVSIAYVVPKIEATTRINLDETARRLAGAIIFARNEAIFKKKNLRIKYEIEENKYSIKEIVRTSIGYMQEDYGEEELTTVELEEGVSFMDIDTQYSGKTGFGSTYTHFFTSGMVEKTVIHLENEDDVVKTLLVNVLTGEVDIKDDYYEEEM